VETADEQPLSGRREHALYTAMKNYRKNFNWDVSMIGETVVLTLSGAVTAVAISRRCLRHVRRLIELGGDPCVALRIPGQRDVAVVFADARDHVPGTEQPSTCVHMISSAHEVLLPPSRTEHGPVRWLNKPDPARRWLPSIASVLCAASRQSHR
jgi:hypothetical protein